MKRDFDLNANLKRLTEQIKNGHKFAIFLGAGSSACKPNPAIPTANEIIASLRQMFPNRNLGKSYSQVLKHSFPKQEDRRIYFERVCAAKIPCLHHYQLAALIDRQIFSTVYTTNFDRIAESAILHYCTSHPAVYMHDSEIEEEGAAETRPKILKLHGDFLFESLANLPKELREKLHDGMRRKLLSHFRNQGLVVVGFSGGDKTIMSLLKEAALNPACLKDGLYWICREQCPRAEVSSLLDLSVRNQKEALLIQSTDADALFGSLCKSLEIRLRALPHFGIRPDKCISPVVGVPRFFPHARQPVPRSSDRQPVTRSKEREEIHARVAVRVADAIGTNGCLWLSGSFEMSKSILSGVLEKVGDRPIFYFDCRFARNEPSARNLMDDLIHFAADNGISSSGSSATSVFNQLASLKAIFVLVGSIRKVGGKDFFENYFGETASWLLANVIRNQAGTVVFVEERSPSSSVLRFLRNEVGTKLLDPSLGVSYQGVSYQLGAQFIRLGNLTMIVGSSGPIEPREIGIRVLKIPAHSSSRRPCIKVGKSAREFLGKLRLLRFAETPRAISLLTDVRDAKALLSQLVAAGYVEYQGERYRASDCGLGLLGRRPSRNPKLHLDLASRYERLFRGSVRGRDNDATHYLFEAESHFYSAEQFTRAAKLLAQVDCSFNLDKSFSHWWRSTLEDFLELEGIGRRTISLLRQHVRAEFLMKFEDACERCGIRPNPRASRGRLIVDQSLDRIYKAIVQGKREERGIRMAPLEEKANQHDRAIKQYREAAKLLSARGPSVHLGFIQSTIAYCFFSKAHFDGDNANLDRGARWTLAAAKTFAKLDEKLSRAKALDDLAFHMIQRTMLFRRNSKYGRSNVGGDNHLKKAEYFSREALEILASVPGLTHDKAVAYGNAASICLLKGDVGRAEGCFLESSLHYAAVGDLVGLSRLYFSLYNFARESERYDVRSRRRIYQVAFFVWGYSRPEIMFQQMVGVNLDFFQRCLEAPDPIGAARAISQLGYITRDFENEARIDVARKQIARFYSTFGEGAVHRYLMPQLKRNRLPWWEFNEVKQMLEKADPSD